jgi:hypothetical protein
MLDFPGQKKLVSVVPWDQAEQRIKPNKIRWLACICLGIADMDHAQPGFSGESGVAGALTTDDSPGNSHRRVC